MQKRSIAALFVAGLLIATGIIYLVSAYEEPIEAAAEGADEAGDSSGNSASHDSDATNVTGQGMDAGTMVQTSFFAIAGLASLGIAAWIVKARAGKMRIPMIIAAAGSAFLIALYIASRTISLPVVGIQDDISTMDIASKVMQGAVVALSLLVTTKWQKVSPNLANTRQENGVLYRSHRLVW